VKIGKQMKKRRKKLQILERKKNEKEKRMRMKEKNFEERVKE
jgi:hypothetical protein